MTLILSNSEVESLFTMQDCIEVLEEGYRELALGHAVNAPRTDMFFPTADPGTFYKFKCIQGGIPKLGVVGQRVQSDRDHFYEENGALKLADHRETYLSNVFLYSMDTLELLAIVQDGQLQRMRVAGICAVAARYLARDDAHVLGLYGAGFQAESMIAAMRAVRPVERVRVFSPTSDRRAVFCERMTKQHGIEVEPLEDPAQVPIGADIVACATNSVTPGVCQGQWLQPGAYLTCIKYREFDGEAYDRCAKIFHTNLTEGLEHFYELYVPRGAVIPERTSRAEGEDTTFYKRFVDRMASLESLLVGEVKGRETSDEIIMFMKGMGNGTEFTATAKRAYDLAHAQGAGREVPSDWFSQITHAPWAGVGRPPGL